MKGYRLTVDGQTFEVEILGDPRQDEVQVRVDGEILTVQVSHLVEPVLEVPDAARAPAAVPRENGLSAGGSILASPLPGKILEVTVIAGQNVGIGDELLVIEAMKMNNLIRSPRIGTIGEILVRVGEQIVHGAPLLSWAD